MFKKTAILVSIIYLLIVSVIIKYVSTYGWDDGSITLAYGKTIANCGKYSLNQASEIVEGSSSNLLVFFTIIVYRLFQPNFYQIITWAQCNALFFTFVTVFLTFKLLNEKYNQWEKLVIVFLMSVFPMFFMEILNGMEMTMFSSIILLFIYLYRRKSLFVYGIIPLLLLVRFEAVFYLLLSLFLICVFDLKNRNLNIKLFIFTFLVFVLMTGVRYIYFGQVLPNTVLAKMNPPYSGSTYFEVIRQKIGGVIEFFRTFSFIFFVLFLLIYKQKKSVKAFFKLEFSLIISFFVFSIIAGRNGGYSGRMLLPILPVVILFFTDFNLSGIQKAVSFKYISIIILLSVLVNYKTYKQVYDYVVTGGFYQHLYLPENIKKNAENKLNRYFYGVTPENYKVTGNAVDHLRKQLQLNNIKFLTPDVGGIGLSTDKVTILDSALLTNKFLANYGYSRFYEYLETNNPDVIETHGAWSDCSKIYYYSFFKNNYVPVIFENNFLWLNRIHLEKIKKLKYKYVIYDEVSEDTRYFVDEVLPFQYPKILRIL